MPGVSVLVPVLNEAEILASFLHRLRHIGVSEIIVADGCSEDGSADIAREHADKLVTSAPGRGRQIAEAARHATQDIFWILHCDSTPPDNALAEMTAVLDRPNVLMGAFPIAFGSDHPLLHCFSFCSRFDSRLTTFGDQGFFLRAADYWRVDGVPETSLFEDVALRQRIKGLGRIAKTKSVMRTSARRFLKRGVVCQQVMNGVLLTRYFAGADAEELAKVYREMD
jgi:rSAM/selenodomain-associated transferase 2